MQCLCSHDQRVVVTFHPDLKRKQKLNEGTQGTEMCQGQRRDHCVYFYNRNTPVTMDMTDQTRRGEDIKEEIIKSTLLLSL